MSEHVELRTRAGITKDKKERIGESKKAVAFDQYFHFVFLCECMILFYLIDLISGSFIRRLFYIHCTWTGGKRPP